MFRVCVLPSNLAICGYWSGMRCYLFYPSFCVSLHFQACYTAVGFGRLYIFLFLYLLVSLCHLYLSLFTMVTLCGSGLALCLWLWRWGGRALRVCRMPLSLAWSLGYVAARLVPPPLHCARCRGYIFMVSGLSPEVVYRPRGTVRAWGIGLRSAHAQ